MNFWGKPIDPSKSLSAISKKNAGESGENGKTEKVKNGEVKTEATFQPRSPVHTLAQVILPEKTTKDIEILLARIEHHDVLYNEWELGKIDPRGKNVAVNLYGPPGTGKTMLAEALVAELKTTMIDVSYAEIESKFVGETGKNIKKAFQVATETQSVLFFDEADSILGKRMTNVTQAADHGVNVARAVMLKQLDSFDGIVIFATNLAKNFDGAFVRRILQHIEIPIPVKEAGKAMFSAMISEKVPGRDFLDMDKLAELSDGLSGGEIKNSIVIALSAAVSRKGDLQKVSQKDFEEGIGSTKKAKKDVGRYDYDG